MKIHQQEADIFDKTHSFEVSIGLLPLIICQNGAKVFNKMCSFEVSIGLLPLISIVSSKESMP